MIKRFKTFLSEGLTDIQKSGFTNYASRRGVDINDDTIAVNLSRHIIPEGTDSIKIPAMNSLVQDIHDHLTNNGYHGIDYGKGVAFKNIINNRGEQQRQEVKIGKALNQTKASKPLIDRFANDDHKKSAELTSKYDVIISRNKFHVAGCSTNPDNPNMWDSCAKLDSKGETKYTEYAAGHLPFDIKHGTHVAYLVPKDDNKTHDELIDRAEGRILLKPFHPVNGVDKPILYPESRAYSINDKTPSGFTETVRNFANTHFPMADNVIYKKHKDLYDDDRIGHVMKIDLNKPITGYNPNLSDLIRNQKINPEDITKFLDSGHKTHNTETFGSLLSYLPQNKSFNSSHIKQYIDNGLIDKMDSTNNLLSHKDFNQHHFDYHIDNLIKNNNSSAITNLLYNNNVSDLITPDHISKIVNHTINNTEKINVRTINAIVSNKHTSFDHIKSLIDAKNHNIDLALSENYWGNHKHKNKIVDALSKIDNKEVRTSLLTKLLNNPEDLSEKHIDNIMQHKTLDLSSLVNISKSPSLSGKHIDKLLDTIDKPTEDEDGWRTPYIINNISRNQNLTGDHVNRLLNTDYAKNYGGGSVASRIFNVKKFSHEDLDKIIPNLSDENVGIMVPRQDLATRHIDYLLNHPVHSKNKEMIDDIANTQKLSPEHIDHLFSKNDNELNFNIAINQNLEPRHIDHLIKTNHYDTINSMVYHNQLTKEQHNTVLDAMGDNRYIKNNVASSKHLPSEIIDRLLDDKHSDNFDNLTRLSLLRNPTAKLSEHHFTKLLSNPSISTEVLKSISTHKDITPNNIDHIINKYINGDSFMGKEKILTNIMNNPNTKEHQKDIIKLHKEYNHWL